MTGLLRPEQPRGMLTSNLEVLTMTMILDATSHACNTQAKLSTEIRKAIAVLYHAHFTDRRIADELRIPLSQVEEFRLARFLNPK